MNVTLNADRALYIVASPGGTSCLGFDNARGHADQIAARLQRPDLAFGAEDRGTLAGYAKYQAAIAAWARSPLRRETYFDPGTDPKAAKALETCRRDERKVRIMYGNTETGECWMEEHDVVGRIGRSGGTLKSPLLIEPGECGGIAILTACVLRVIAWDSGRDLYRHPAYRAPTLSLRHAPQDEKLPWQVLCGDQPQAAFADIGKACGYLAFMCGETVEPRVFQ